MTRRMLTLSGWVVAAGALMLLGGTRWAHSQAPFPEGAFVAAQDGTYWVVGGGARYRLSFVTGDAGALSTLRQGSMVVSTVAEAQAALAGGASAPAAEQPPANPAETLVGQRVTACNYGVDFDIAVTRVEWTKTVLDATAPGNGMWIVAFIDVTNLGTTAEALVTRPVQVRDGRGREYNVKEYPPDPVDLAAAYQVKGAFENFEPGITETSVVTFQVPADVGPLTLVGKRDFC